MLFEQRSEIERADCVATRIGATVGGDRAGAIILPFEQNSEIGSSGDRPASFRAPEGGYRPCPIALVFKDQAEVECSDCAIVAMRCPMVAARFGAEVRIQRTGAVSVVLEQHAEVERGCGVPPLVRFTVGRSRPGEIALLLKQGPARERGNGVTARIRAAIDVV